VSRALSAELFKLRTTRTSWGVTLGSIGLVVIISLIAALAGDFSGEDPTNPPGPDLLQIAGLVQIFALVLGILIVATEFRHGTITPSLLAVPDRSRLVLAKLTAALAAGALLGLVAIGLCTALIFPILSARDIDAGGTTNDVLELIAGNAVASALYAALGVGLGALLRNQVGAIIGALGWIFLVEPLLGIIPGFDDVITKWFPTGAANAAAGTATADDALAQVPAGLLLTAYAAVFVAAGIVVIRRRDISA
jgi:ABC-2 type transport system permease protein